MHYNLVERDKHPSSQAISHCMPSSRNGPDPSCARSGHNFKHHDTFAPPFSTPGSDDRAFQCSNSNVRTRAALRTAVSPSSSSAAVAFDTITSNFFPRKQSEFSAQSAIFAPARAQPSSSWASTATTRACDHAKCDSTISHSLRRV